MEEITGMFGMMGMMMGNPVMVFFWGLLRVFVGVVLLWALVDLAKSKQDAMSKVFWLLVITMAGNLHYSLFGLIIYYFLGRKKK